MNQISHIKSALIALAIFASGIQAQMLEDFIGNWTGVEMLQSPTINYENKHMTLDITEGGDRDDYLVYLSNCEFIYNPEVSWAHHYFGIDKNTNELLFIRRFDTPIGVVFDELRYSILHWNNSTLEVEYHSESGDTYHLISLTSNSLDLKEQVPERIALNQNFPNPFNPNTNITIESEKNALGSLMIYNLNGQKIKTLHSGKFQKGLNSFNWNGQNQNGIPVSGGTYIYRLLIDGNTQSQKMVLLK